ncbi:MAG: methylated-DNA--[protein]-cysteine S-methyltransferase [Candidatus Zixiibacteriota bacterium]
MIKKTLYVHSFQTAIGLIRSAATSKGLALISLPVESTVVFEKKIQKYFSNFEILNGGETNKKFEKQLSSYLDGRLHKFTLKLDIQATPFQEKILGLVARIPFGKTVTYGEIARQAGRPRACRAVGHANAANNLPLVIPCHRVVAADGLGGYGGGLNLKRKLLKIEGVL